MPSGASSASAARGTLLAVVERLVEAQLANPGELLRRARAADDAAAGYPRHLAGRASHRTRSARDEHGLALLGLAEDEEPVPGRETGHAEDAERGRDRRDGRIEPSQGGAVGERPLAPAELVQDPLTFRVPRVARDGDTPDRTAGHRLAERERRDVRAHVVHPRAHVRVDREVRVPDEHLSLGRSRNRRLGHLEEVLPRKALRPRDEADLASDALHATMIRRWSPFKGTCSSPGRRSSTRTSGGRWCSSASTRRRARSASS